MIQELRKLKSHVDACYKREGLREAEKNLLH